MRQLLGYIRRNHVGLIALVLALSGTAYAATQISSKQIKNKSITAKDIKPKTLKGQQVKDGSLQGVDIADGSLSGADVADGSLSGVDLANDSLTGAQIDESSLNVTRVVAKLRDPDDQVVPRGGVQTSLNDSPSWTQLADESDQFLGQFIVKFPVGCNPGRNVQMFLSRPGLPFPAGVVAIGSAQSTNAGNETVIGGIQPISVLGVSDPDAFEPGASTTRKLKVIAAASCGGGSTDDPVVSDVNVDVIGSR